jgi:hypothetical protein
MTAGRTSTSAVQRRERICAYDDFTHSLPRVTVAKVGSDPLMFTIDNSPGQITGAVNPGHRLAIDKKSGAVYSAFSTLSSPVPITRQTSISC